MVQSMRENAKTSGTVYRIPVEWLEEASLRMRDQMEHRNMSGCVAARIGRNANGELYLELEQGCCYAECSSHYERFLSKA